MGIEALKEKENLKENLAKLRAEITQREKKELQDCVDAIVSGFMRYFEEKEFAVVKNRADVVATYKGLSFSLVLPKNKEELMGARFGLNILLSNKEECLVLIRSASNGGLSISIGKLKVETTTEDETEKLRKDIDEAKELLQKSIICPLVLSIRTKRKNLDLKEFPDISAILDALINE